MIGCSLWELPPGEAAYPYHFHYSDEELIVVVQGQPTLRTPEGSRQLEEREALRFSVGQEGPTRSSTAPRRRSPFWRSAVMAGPMSSSIRIPEKVGVGERLARGGELRAFFRRADAVDYWDGEQPPEPDQP